MKDIETQIRKQLRRAAMDQEQRKKRRNQLRAQQGKWVIDKRTKR